MSDQTGSTFGPQPLILDAFAGLNTEASRPGIPDDQCSWLDGFFPIGHSNARAIWGIGAECFSAPGGTFISFFDFANIGPTPYCIAILSDGSIWTARTDTFAIANIAPAGTITVPSQLSCDISQWGSSFVIIVAQQTNGYFLWDGTTFYMPGDTVPGDIGGTMPTGIGGNAVETFKSRVWIVNDANAYFSAPESIVDFATSSGGGTFSNNDSHLRVKWTSLISLNGFLYLIGDSSYDYISNVQTSGNPPTTVFDVITADVETGTPWPNTVDSWGQSILFANPIGAYLTSGGNTRKISDMLDGIYTTVPNQGGFTPSAAKCFIHGKKAWALLMQVLTPFSEPPPYCATPVEIDLPAFLTYDGALSTLPATSPYLFFSVWLNLPDDSNQHGLWFSNQDDDTTPGNAGIQIGIFNDTSSSASHQIVVRAYDATDTQIVTANYAMTAWGAWAWIAVSIDTTTQTMQVYVNSGMGDQALTPAAITWASSNPVGNTSGHVWHYTPSSGP